MDKTASNQNAPIINNKKIILPGGAGLVGQNLIPRLLAQGYSQIVVLDKHQANLSVVRQMHPNITAEFADLAVPGDWAAHFKQASVVVMLQAQIGGNDYETFYQNNVNATQHILAAMKKHQVPSLVHISSSVVESVANDDYTNTKKAQEQLVLESQIPCITLRPTLMFGWFDRKHLGWLSRFMKKTPVFPIPGKGNYMRQPLYAGDFCNIILSCINNEVFDGKVYNISGHEKISYLEMIKTIKSKTDARSLLLPIPYRFFYFLLALWSCFDKNPPFTTQQLTALVANDEFEMIDWPSMFNVTPTPFEEAINETFNHPTYSKVIVSF